mmetsp:Transcript_4579/g.15246  ORF Transcript_4579/g.15246 Transcript_4579/m.15246 type:complete len:230 (-) Transcript_4579:89-778(-)
MVQCLISVLCLPRHPRALRRHRQRVPLRRRVRCPSPRIGVAQLFALQTAPRGGFCVYPDWPGACRREKKRRRRRGSWKVPTQQHRPRGAPQRVDDVIGKRGPVAGALFVRRLGEQTVGVLRKVSRKGVVGVLVKKLAVSRERVPRAVHPPSPRLRERALVVEFRAVRGVVCRGGGWYPGWRRAFALAVWLGAHGFESTWLLATNVAGGGAHLNGGLEEVLPRGAEDLST